MTLVSEHYGLVAVDDCWLSVGHDKQSLMVNDSYGWLIVVHDGYIMMVELIRSSSAMMLPNP